MYSFKNDYSEGCHPRILELLITSNMEQEPGYGEDIYCHKAKEAIYRYLESPSSAIHFVSGGTQANLVVISAFLKPHESVIAVDTGHIAVHEAGAIEATGHKICLASHQNGKITPKSIQIVLDKHTNEHMVKPAMVYISNTTELGTVYTKQELQSIREYCQKHNLLLFVDGARIGSALLASEHSPTLSDYAKYSDIFYIGATKNGGLCGEAIIINNTFLQDDFRRQLKQKGALLAKGRLIGIQFFELFRDGLFFELARHANTMAKKLTDSIGSMGYDFLCESNSNQIFPLFPQKLIDHLSQQFSFYVREKGQQDIHAIRLVTSRATKEVAVDAFLDLLKTYHR